MNLAAFHDRKGKIAGYAASLFIVGLGLVTTQPAFS
jgi:hypothetical protein